MNEIKYKVSLRAHFPEFMIEKIGFVSSMKSLWMLKKELRADINWVKLKRNIKPLRINCKKI